MLLTANAVSFEKVVQTQTPEVATSGVRVCTHVIAATHRVQRQLTHYKPIDPGCPFGYSITIFNITRFLPHRPPLK